MKPFSPKCSCETLSPKKKSPNGDCDRCRSCRVAPPVKAGPSGPVVPGPLRQPPWVLRVRWPKRPPPHRSPYIYSRLDHLLSRRTQHHGPSTRQPEADRRCGLRTWPALTCPITGEDAWGPVSTPTGRNHTDLRPICLAFLAGPRRFFPP